MAKLKSTYTDNLPEQIDPDTGRIHTSYHQAVAATGRLSSTDPNLQNIPIRTQEGRRIRQAFVAPPGSMLVAADYSQIELRIMAHLSGDASLLRAFAEDRDVHQATAAEVFGLRLGAGQRRSAALGEGDQLRPDVWHVRVRPGAAAGDWPRRRAEIHGSLFRALSRREALHGRDAPAGARHRVTSKRCSAAGCICRKFNRAMRRCANTPNAAPSMRPCREPRPTSSSAP